MFATLQSAAMGGYGAAIVNGVTSFGAGLMGVGVGAGLVGESNEEEGDVGVCPRDSDESNGVDGVAVEGVK